MGMGITAAELRERFRMAAVVVGLAVAIMVAAPDTVIDVQLEDVTGGTSLAALAIVPAFGAMELLVNDLAYGDAQLVGQVFNADEIGDFLVCGTTAGHVHFYQVETCSLGRMEAAAFNRAVKRGLIHWQSDLSELVGCPHCNAQLEVITNGQVNGQPEPFVSCTACAFAEELFG
jgi:hypothetical protein